MRSHVAQDGLTVNAIAGTHVVFLGLNIADAKRPELRGFAIKRHDHVEGETTWMRGMKTFQKTQRHAALGDRFSTRHHPVQSFQWADYSAKPGRRYSYTVVARYGDAASLEDGATVKVDVTTETEDGKTHSAFFNRGSVASQEYARRFQNDPPRVAGPSAYEWLSRGLLEALVRFLDRTKDGWEIHGAVYEFQWHEALDAIRRAADRGAAVQIIFDDEEKTDAEGKAVGPWQRNRAAIAAAGIAELCQGRTNARLMHNKFFVISRSSGPVAVWTGSTNLTENGIFGHSNVGHVVEDRAVAQTFLDYWQRLEADPTVNNAFRTVNRQANPSPSLPLPVGTTAVFSPRDPPSQPGTLDAFAAIAGGAQRALFMTFAFGMNERFKDVYRKDDDVLRTALMEGVASSPQTRVRDQADIADIRRRRNTVVAIGNRIESNSFDRWLAEQLRIVDAIHVYWVHTKYALIDPLDDEPTLMTGSANFSLAGTVDNDENMLVIKGDKRIADIYLGEYSRLYAHYAFREVLRWHRDQDPDAPGAWRPDYLRNDDGWTDDWFDPEDKVGRFARRSYFGGAMAV